MGSGEARERSLDAEFPRYLGGPVNLGQCEPHDRRVDRDRPAARGVEPAGDAQGRERVMASGISGKGERVAQPPRSPFTLSLFAAGGAFRQLGEDETARLRVVRPRAAQCATTIRMGLIVSVLLNSLADHNQ